MGKVTKQCEYCGDTFSRYASYFKLRPGRYCSKQCELKQRAIDWRNDNPSLHRDLAGANNPMFMKTPWNYREEGNPRADGYMRVTVNGKRMLKHRFLMEQMVGRELSDDEIVHHLDGDNTNNDPSNLTVMSQSQHLKTHIKEWDAKFGTGWRRGASNYSLSAPKMGQRAA